MSKSKFHKGIINTYMNKHRYKPCGRIKSNKKIVKKEHYSIVQVRCWFVV